MSKSIKLFKFIKTKMCPAMVVMYAILSIAIECTRPEYMHDVHIVGIVFLCWYLVVTLMDIFVSADLKDKNKDEE